MDDNDPEVKQIKAVCVSLKFEVLLISCWVLTRRLIVGEYFDVYN